MSEGIICGPSLPKIGSIVPLRRMLHDNGFGSCLLIVKGLYGEKKARIFCSFSSFPSSAWHPDELSPHSLAWLEQKLASWDNIWPDAEWTIKLVWPWQSEEWYREKPKCWRVRKASTEGSV